MCDTSLSLLDRLQLGASDSAWREVVELYSPLLDDWLARFQLQRADREDLVQESLTTVLQHVGSFRHGDQGSFRAWLRAIVVNRVREFWRRRGRHPQATGDSQIADMLQQLESPGSSLGRQ
jgi:RNA polymerase sigma factor (sigma-70 family)